MISLDLRPFVDYDPQTDTLHFKELSTVFEIFAGRAFKIGVRGIDPETLLEISHDTSIAIPVDYLEIPAEDLLAGLAEEAQSDS